MAYDFSKLTSDQAIALIRSTRSTGVPATVIAIGKVDIFTGRRDEAQIRQFLSGDHWQGGRGWVGPKPSKTPGAATLDSDMMRLIQERFVSRNMIEDVTTRHVDGVLGREPSWSLVPKRALKNAEKPNPAEQAAIDEAEAAITAWWDKRKCHKLFQDGSAESLLSGRAILRLYVPASRLKPLIANIGKSSTPIDTTPAAPAKSASPSQAGVVGAIGSGDTVRSGPPVNRPATPTSSSTGALGDDTGPTDAPSGGEDEDAPQLGVVAADLEEALDHIFVEMVTAENATVFTDADTQDKVGVVVYYGQGTTPGTTGPRVVELSYLDGTPDLPVGERGTVIRRITLSGNVSDAAADNFAAPPLDLGGQLTHFAIERDPLISEQMVQLQMALNLAVSMLPRNVETSGYLQRILTNAQLPGEWEVDALGEKTGRFKLGTFVTGAGVTNFVTGAEVTDANGNTTLETPGVITEPPAPVTPTIEAIDALEAEILSEAKQAHVLGADQAQSGISREQARADFSKSLGRSESAINPAGRWLIETVMAMAELFSPSAQNYSEVLRCEFTCFADTGPLDTREMTAVTTANENDLISDETAMAALGVEDTDAELAKLNAQDGRRISTRTKKAEALKAYTDAGLSLPAAAKMAGFDEEEIDFIKADALANPPVPLPGSQRPALNPDGTPKLDASGRPVMELTPPADNPLNKKPGEPGGPPSPPVPATNKPPFPKSA